MEMMNRNGSYSLSIDCHTDYKSDHRHCGSITMNVQQVILEDILNGVTDDSIHVICGTVMFVKRNKLRVC